MTERELFERELWGPVISEICGDEFEPTGTLSPLMWRIYRKTPKYGLCSLHIIKDGTAIGLDYRLDGKLNRPEWPLTDPNMFENIHKYLMKMSNPKNPAFWDRDRCQILHDHVTGTDVK